MEERSNRDLAVAGVVNKVALCIEYGICRLNYQYDDEVLRFKNIHEGTEP